MQTANNLGFEPQRQTRLQVARTSTTSNDSRPGSPLLRVAENISAVASVSTKLATPDFVFQTNVLPELIVNDVASAVALADIMLNAGLPSLLVSCTSPLAWDAVASLRTALPQLQLGATVSPAELAQPHTRSADFLCYRPRAQRSALPAKNAVVATLPILTHLRDLPRFRDSGQTLIALAPDNLHTGLALLKALSAQAPLLRVCITGNIARQDTPLYLMKTNVVAVSSPWIVAPELLRRRDWSAIQQQARAAAALRMM